ncbi:MAG: bifunctional 4-hydroxy-3-methylbut-2-enyl diphosphate reductase/30S ribosomal protein S1 [Clostridia bacterium]|nr:bifunctional 4-hydroxy-3-methylbut-2-enyl diphosphate reductase/30S ribosomal protein S1 [Clostridia bacterium]
MMKIEAAKSAGFCFGVKRAVEKAYECAEDKEKKYYTLGPIIHNGSVIEDLNSKGVTVIDSLDDLKDNNATVIIRAHGVPKAVYDYLEERKIEFIDLTCPFVKKIHNIVKEKYEEGYKIIVVGKREHPEVTGINGWCENSAYIVFDEDIDEEYIKSFDKICVVAQTTVNKEKFYNYIKFLKNTCNCIEVFDTICSATEKRQTEAYEIAQRNDMMIVVGGENSSNSQELYKLCKSVCPETYLIQNASQLKSGGFENKNIGITAGASTPAYIIKEVLNIMSEVKTMPNGEENFADILENYLNSSLHIGQVVKGTVDRVSPTEINVNIIGFKGVGIISLDDLTDDPQAKTSDVAKIGDEIEAMVIKKNDLEGYVLLSKKKVDSYKNIEKIKAYAETQEIVNGKVVEINKGGASVLVDSVKVFVPNSLATERFTEDISFLMNTEVALKIIDFDERRKRAVGSIKAVLVEEKKKLQDAFWAGAEVGKVYQGTVKSLTNFGAFVDLGGVDGLVHISELSWGRIKHPSEVLKEGDVAEVYIKDIDQETKKISLGFKKAEDNPWVKVANQIKVGDTIECKIVRLVPFGAFAEIIPFVDGLIHISQISDKRINKPADELKIGEVVEAKVIDMDLEKQKISLSIRALLENIIIDDAEAAPAAEEVAPVEEAAEEVVEEAPVEEAATEE